MLHVAVQNLDSAGCEKKVFTRPHKSPNLVLTSFFISYRLCCLRAYLAICLALALHARADMQVAALMMYARVFHRERFESLVRQIREQDAAMML